MVPCQYVSAERFSGERAWVRTSAKAPAQAIDLNGDVRVRAPDGYELLARFLNGVALVATSNPVTREYKEHYLTAEGEPLQASFSHPSRAVS